MKSRRIEEVKKEFSLFRLQDLTMTLAEFERTSSYNQYDASTRYVMEMLKQAGFRKSAEAGCTQALFKLGVFYYDGLGVQKDLRMAAKFFFQAARQGYVRAQYNLACLFEMGAVTGKADPEAAFYWFQQAARGGDAAAQRRTGECYLNGVGVDRSISNAEKWLLLAARNGDFTARELLYRIQRSSTGSLY